MNINEKFIINLNGKSYVTYEGLLDLAHQKDLKSIEVNIIQFPSRENGMVAICQAIIKTESELFTDIGDASPSSVTRALVPHIIRMASTRAKARALRDLTNVGMTAIEELDFNDESDDKLQTKERPTLKQLDTIKQLSKQQNFKVDYSNLTKRSAGNLIQELINKQNKK